MIFSKNAKRIFITVSFLSLTAVAYLQDLKSLYNLALHNEEYNHILLIPVVSLYFLYSEHSRIFSHEKTNYFTGKALFGLWLLLFIVSRLSKTAIDPDIYLSLSILTFVILTIAAFTITYGEQSLRKASFPLLFLIFIVPIPIVVLDQIVAFLLKGSANISDFLFHMLGVPYFREGPVFHLPGISVEVAKQCSGIRSTTALLITSILAGHLFLAKLPSKVTLILSVFPVTIFKNGVRITTISLLGAYVDKAWLTNSILHRRGGIFFFILALGIMFPFIVFLRKMENRWAYSDLLKSPNKSTRKTF